VTRAVRFLGAARAELRKEVAFYEEQLPGLGAELVAEIEYGVRQLRSFPELGKPAVAGTRQLAIRRFPFLLVYRIREDELIVVAVAHQRRNPSYWQRRR
jgi:plasmid stabilization system protein ParE